MDQAVRHTILFIDDHPVYREGLVLALQRCLPGVRLLAVADGNAGLELLAREEIDLVLTDFRLSAGEDGLALLAHIVSTYPSVAAGILCADATPELSRRAQQARAIACLSKERSAELLAEAILRLLAGETVFDAAPPQISATRLSERRLTILRLSARGLSNKEIATLLNIGDRTLKDHWQIIFARLLAKNRAQAISIAHTRGLLHDDGTSG